MQHKLNKLFTLESEGWLLVRNFPSESVVEFQLATHKDGEESYNNLTYTQLYELKEWIEQVLDIN
jgi:hypothetical protein